MPTRNGNGALLLAHSNGNASLLPLIQPRPETLASNWFQVFYGDSANAPIISACIQRVVTRESCNSKVLVTPRNHATSQGYGLIPTQVIGMRELHDGRKGKWPRRSSLREPRISPSSPSSDTDLPVASPVLPRCQIRRLRLRANISLPGS
jgi:hypothetical protein